MKLGFKAQDKIRQGINKLASAVVITLGPRGRNVVLDQENPIITNDGVTIAKRVKLKDKYEQIGVKLMQEVADKTNKQAGDGTTTSIVLAQTMFEQGMKMISMGINPLFIRNGLQKCAKEVVKCLDKNSIKLDKSKIKDVASLSAESKELGAMIAGVVEQVGGAVYVEDSPGTRIETEITQGLLLEQGYISSYFITDQKQLLAGYEEANICLVNAKLSTIYDIKPIAEAATKEKLTNLVIIAKDISDDALSTMVVNKTQGNFKFLGIKIPGHSEHKQKEWLDDISAATGAKILDTEDILSGTVIGFGKCQKVIAKDRITMLIGGYGEQKAVKERIVQLKTLMASSEDIFKPEYKERIARMDKGVAVIKVGAMSEAEKVYLRMKIEDAVNATNAAIAEGILPGGGIGLLKAREGCLGANLTPDEEPARIIMSKTLESCIRRLSVNSGDNPDSIIERTEKEDKNFGYDFSNKEYGDLIKLGVIDPLKVVKTAFLNAVSMVANLLTTECLVLDSRPKQEAKRI